MLMEFLKTERNHLVNKIRDLERKMTNFKADSDRFQKKVHEQEITIMNLESKLELADKENQHYKKTVDTFIRELSIKIKADSIKKGSALPLRSHTYNFDRSEGYGGLTYGSHMDLDLQPETRLDRPASSFDHRSTLIDPNRTDPTLLQRPRSRLNEFKSNMRADYGIDPKMNKSFEDNKNHNLYSSTSNAFYGRERQLDNLTELKSQMSGTNDFLKGFNSDIDKILNKDRSNLTNSSYNPSKRGMNTLGDSHPKPLYHNDSDYYNTGFRPNDLNVYKRDSMAKTTGNSSNPLNAYVSKYGRKEDDMGLTRTGLLNGRADSIKDQFMQDINNDRPLGGILKYKQN